MRRPQPRTTIALALVALALALPVPGLWVYQGPPMEEGFMLAFPQRILAGDLPHVDFLHLYGPGSLYVLAAIYKVFGSTLGVERAVGLVQHLLLVSACSSSSARGVGGRQPAPHSRRSSSRSHPSASAPWRGTGRSASPSSGSRSSAGRSGSRAEGRCSVPVCASAVRCCTGPTWSSRSGSQRWWHGSWWAATTRRVRCDDSA